MIWISQRGLELFIAYNAAQVNGTTAGSDNQTVEAKRSQAAGVRNMPLRPICSQPVARHIHYLKKL
jgi:hypothetical protein